MDALSKGKSGGSRHDVGWHGNVSGKGQKLVKGHKVEQKRQNFDGVI